MNKEYDVFISYSRKNSKFINRLSADLERHQISVWLDTQEIEVGDQFRAKIEEGISSSRYFCLAMSPSSLKSYYVRKFELEAAFTLMVRNGRETFILPILLKKISEPLPLMLSSFHYLDFSKSLKYISQLEKLIKRIHLGSEDFTGSRWYKNIDVSPYGFPSGVDLLNHISYSGNCVKAFFEKGLLTKVETYTDGKLDGRKLLQFDLENRIYEYALYRNDRHIDTWRYFYDQKTKIRKIKQVLIAGEKPHFEIFYEKTGNRLEERNLNQQGELKMNNGFARKTFEYNNGNLCKETWYDVDNAVIKTINYP